MIRLGGRRLRLRRLGRGRDIEEYKVAFTLDGEVYAFSMQPERPKDLANCGLDESKRLFLMLGLSGSVQFMLGLLLKEQKRETVASPKTFDELIYTIQSTVGISHFYDLEAQSSEQPEDDADFAQLAMIKDGMRQLYSYVQEGADRPTKTVEEIKKTIAASTDYYSNYRLSPANYEKAQPSKIDCNDHANVKCDVLSDQGIPMHFLAIWPREPGLRWRKSWHLMATCKMNDAEFLIFDNDRSVTHWRGTLAQYGREYHELQQMEISMAVIPTVGISKYVRPYFDTPGAKFVQQGHQSIAEEQMEQLGIRPTRKEGMIA